MGKKKSWREIYIGILLNGPNESEYLYAAELIDEGYAKGNVLKNDRGKGSPIENISWKGPTTSGREYLDELQTKVRRQSLSFRLLSLVAMASSWLLGFLSQVLVQWIGKY